ncbi:low molecular weight phosphotyrosine protein phosphatase [Sinirhodobacter sp. WL0062]|uniref:protein-tyrosine-phosphatase n=1 Tax=Rhodobacter flavimaris TaxID=2907145 RepID=A0ABS8YV63_9RHOB|nr:low molecular weight protein-tyrosine-phosphatase [Sinirhodobacter sp. WL0062]MCE5973741.1 low molecular weight phosphotyrosine protein phosphatase [Sinirhodobacter sp. WL0062]
MPMRILFLCLGNICRSPAAEGVFREMAARAGLEAEADSAGTSDWHLGEPPYGPMLAAAQARGYELSSLRARQLTRDDFERFDLILAMDAKNLAKAETIRPAAARADLRLFLDAKTGTQDVPDPYYTRDFDGCLDLIEDGARRLIAALQPPQ